MSDWEDGGSTAVDPKPSGGFGGGFGRGIGRGKVGFSTGIGRSRGRGFQNSNGGFSSGGFTTSNGTSNGFGSGVGGGFGRGSGFGDSTTNGSTGGFGSFGGFGGGRSEDLDAPRGGGFNDAKRDGSSNASGRGCYRCGEEGHIGRDCPNNNSGSGGGGGFGGRSGGGGGSRACFKCNETGHMARECPNFESSGGGGFGSRGGGGGGFGGGGGSGCRKCGEEGHFARECPNSESSGGGDRTCYKCSESGHIARDCPTSGGSGGGGGGGNKCFKCNEEGHFSRECPNATEDDKKREPNYIPPEPSEDEAAIFDSMQRGINFDKYDEIPVECSGDGRPTRGISDFDEADLSPLFRNNVRKAKYEKPTPVQRWSIPIIRQGRDLMACAQTGSGKTAAFLLPVLTGMVEKGAGGGSMMATQNPMAIIIGPTRELVMQIYNEARKFAHGSMIRPVVVYGGTSVSHQLSQISRGANMVIGTPGRMADFITRGAISLAEVRYLILDEADRMLDMGFEPEVRKIVEKNGMPAKEERQTLMFSATFPEDIQRLARDFLNNYLFVTVGRVGSANTDIVQTIYEVPQFEKRDKLQEILNMSGKEKVLVFVETKRQADFIASFLSQSQFPTTSIHGDRLQREREEALRDFKTGKAPVLVATSVAARGLDIPGVAHVVNYDLPSDIDEYVHRIGRTGRCGNLGKASSFFDSSANADLARALVKTLEDAQQEVPSFLENAAEMGTGTGFGGIGGKFGGRDARRGKFRNGSSGGSFGGDGGFSGGDGGFGGGDSGFAADDNAEDESWD